MRPVADPLLYPPPVLQRFFLPFVFLAHVPASPFLLNPCCLSILFLPADVLVVKSTALHCDDVMITSPWHRIRA